jgi:hypothetical protein
VASASEVSPSATPGGGFEKKNFNYSPWTKGLFSEVVTVTHPGKMIFLAGVGAEDENGERGIIRNLGELQCQAVERTLHSTPVRKPQWNCRFSAKML